MPTLTLSRLGTLPRLSLASLFARIAAADALHRERSDLATLDERTLRDMGLTRADVDETLRRRDEHLALILARRGHQL